MDATEFYKQLPKTEKKRSLNWWEITSEEFETPLENSDNDTGDTALDTYELNRKTWLKEKIDSDIFTCKEFLKDGVSREYQIREANKDSQDSLYLPKLLPIQSITKKMTLVLDMDETLVHGNVNKLYDYDAIVPITLNNQKF